MPRIRSALSVIPALLLALAVGACASTGSTGGDPFSDAPGAEEIRIEIQNLNFADATVWALVQSGRRIRLGTVRGKSDSVFTLPWDFSLPLRMEIDLVAGGRCLTEELQVDPGDSLLLQIDPVLRESALCR